MRAAAAHLRVAVVVWLAPFAAIAHEGPEHEIEELTGQMNKTGVTAELLSERAAEYRVLGRLPEATKDMERAAALAPRSVVVQRELARVLFLGGRAADAMATVARGLALKPEEPADIASLRMLRAEILLSQNENTKALEDCDAALKLHRQNPGWYLMRSEIQRRLKAHRERVAGLDEGIAETGAGVLGIERVEALLDDGQSAAALKIIEPELQDSRIKSSWLIRRARAFIGLGKIAEAGADLKLALEEIGARLNPKTPDAALLLDKAQAHQLLGDKKEALRAYEMARDRGAADGVNEKIKLLEEPKQPVPTPPAKP